ncbi:MAG TPA: dihydrolipoamide acetyltransferase family protein [Solirubrobacterales bacterium]|jgi:pyruvate dehydrogenase E2 component (dihydrolipoamide acetyltransferase)|nr:dihydrolipoamide acetyltransferase family protein [Solirubrobacterales bacterium]
MPDIVMPRLSDSMEEGTVLKWLKSVGDEVAVGEELVEIETDKANMVYESDAAGTLTEIIAEEGDTLPIGEPIARVGDASEVKGNGEPAEETEAEAHKPAEETEAEAPSGASASPAPASEPHIPAGEAEEMGGGDGEAVNRAPATTDGGRVKASPIARRIARERGVELTALAGSGPGGRIVKADVERALTGGASAPPAPVSQPAAPGRAAEEAAGDGEAVRPAAPTPGAREKPETAKGATEVIELTKIQQTIARRMAESKATAPHFYLQAEIDMTAAVEGRKKLKETAREGDPVPTYNDMVVKACALALREYPRANGSYKDGRIELYSRINVGVAVAAQDALIVPTVFDADSKGLRQIATETKALAARVRDGSITPPELSGGTFSVSNLGMYGISNFHAVINTPQAGILAVGELKAKPVVTDSGEIEARQLMGVTLACDHRILYGADGAQFLARVGALLEEPLGLAL